MVVVEEGDAAASGFEQIFILVLAAEDGFGVQAGLLSNVDERNAEVSAGL